MNEPTNRDTSPEHLLLTLAKTYPAFTGDLAPQGYQYDLFLGAWILNDSGSLLVESPNRPRTMTKKRDIETGEDQKAE